jgi:type IV pilus assembly protein PilX
MMNSTYKSNQAIKPRQQGIALVASLIILLLMTIVGLSIMHGNNFFEKNAANTRDKQRALQAAQDALLYAEWWLSNNASNVSDTTCSTTATPTTLQVCTYDPGPSTANLASSVQYWSYTPTYMTTQGSTNSAAGGLVTPSSATSDVLYAQSPGIYVNCMSCDTPLSTGQTLYRITAIGYGGVGGNNGTVAIVQSVYAAGAAAPVPSPLGDTN